MGSIKQWNRNTNTNFIVYLMLLNGKQFFQKLEKNNVLSKMDLCTLHNCRVICKLDFLKLQLEFKLESLALALLPCTLSQARTLSPPCPSHSTSPHPVLVLAYLSTLSLSQHFSPPCPSLSNSPHPVLALALLHTLSQPQHFSPSCPCLSTSPHPVLVSAFLPILSQSQHFSLPCPCLSVPPCPVLVLAFLPTLSLSQCSSPPCPSLSAPHVTCL